MAQIDFLLDNGLNNSYQNTIDFDNVTSQNTFWDGQVITSIPSNITTSRLLYNSPIVLELTLVQLLDKNYCRIFQDGRYWYFFIINKTFINEKTSSINLELDVMQTFMFDYTINNSMVVREHQDRFNPATTPYSRIYNLINESLDYGNEYILKSTDIITLGSSGAPNEIIYYALIQMANNNQLQSYAIPIQRGSKNILFKARGTDSTHNAYSIDEIYSRISGNNAIYSMTIIPFVANGLDIKYNESETEIILTFNPNLITSVVFSGGSSGQLTYCINIKNVSLLLCKRENIANTNSLEFSINNSPNILLESKLFIFPYQFMNLGDENCVPKIFRYEDLSSNADCTFYYNANFSGIIKEEFYMLNNLGHDIDRNAFVRISPNDLGLTSDAWVNYFNSNKSSIQNGALTRGAETLFNTATGIAGNILAGEDILSTGLNVVKNLGNYAFNEIKIQQGYQDIQLTPDTIRNINNTGYFNIITNRVYPKLKRYDIKDEFKERLFLLFMKFGYANNSIKIPNLKSRYYFNFIQITNANITSNISNEYINQIKNIFSSGITFWHYRNANTWKGVNNYNYENLEMTIVNQGV